MNGDSGDDCVVAPSSPGGELVGAAPYGHAGHCVTCGDDGEPMVVARVDDHRGLALCRGEAGESMTVEIALVEPVAPGDRLLVHAGTAIARLQPEPGLT